MVSMESMAEVWRWVDQMHTEPDLSGFKLADLGTLRRALIAALDEVEVALGPAIVRGAEEGMTYVELAAAGGYGSVTTIGKIMKDAGASPGSGRHPRNRSRVRR